MPQTKSEAEHFPLTFHPRVFSALGSDLVTNDLVAITELVKNSYDAFATEVVIAFGQDDDGEYIEIKDNGSGMSRNTLRDVWCKVATPYRVTNTESRMGNQKRRVTGEKGLGRLSAARLGDHLQLITKAKNKQAYQIEANWSEMAEAESLEFCTVAVEKYRGATPFDDTGTKILIRQLSSEWDDDMLEDLRDHLARLIPPFDILGKKQKSKFSIELIVDDEFEGIEIESPTFLNHPKYKIWGNVDRLGKITWNYEFTPIGSEKAKRESSDNTISWAKQREDKLARKEIRALTKPGCGSFSFEIRAWDIDAAGTADISKAYEIKKQSIRAAIKANKGISIYRDGVLVLPKSESNRDWLGLDRRRISDVGKRISTTQIVGFVAIGADTNPEIQDTSDRERLVDSVQVRAFQHILGQVVRALENERANDRIEAKQASKAVEDLFSKLSGEQLQKDVQAAADSGESAKTTVPLVKKFRKELDKTRGEIERRFVYYSRLATVGTIAEILVHEVRNRTTTIGGLVDSLTKYFEEFEVSETVLKRHELASNALAALDRLADTFAPLASRSYKRGRRSCNLLQEVRQTIQLEKVALDSNNIVAKVDRNLDTDIAVDPGELSAVLLNLIQNSIYWLCDEGGASKQIAFTGKKIPRVNRIEIRVDDNGPGIHSDLKEKVFWPGVTAKRDGIGMGLAVASEIVSAYGGEVKLTSPGYLGGASFSFDLPLKK